VITEAIQILPVDEGDGEVAAAKRLTERRWPAVPLHPAGYADAVPLPMALRATGRIK
jgi:hypothetical protein